MAWRRGAFGLLVCAAWWPIAASKAGTPRLPEIAGDRGFDAALAETERIAGANPSPKKLEKALGEAGFQELTMPTTLMVGANFVLGETSPLHACTWGESIDCRLDAALKGPGKPEDFRLVCKSSFGGALPMEATPASSESGRIAWAVHHVERCWKLGGVSVAVMPNVHSELEGIGAGDDMIPPELAMLSQVEAEQIVSDRTNQFRYCVKKNSAPGSAAKGVMKVRYAIAPDGSVGEAAVAESTFEDANIQGCILDVFRRIRFPPPAGGFSGGTFPITLL